MKELGRDAFPELACEYLREGKTVIGYNVWDDYNHTGLPKLEVKWVWTDVTNGDSNHA
jgi:hypothetical protein